MPSCRTNITMPFEGDSVTVTLAVGFEVSPPDPSVGIFGCGVEALDAKVIDADVEAETPTAPPAVLAALQAELDANLGKYCAAIEEGCIESLADCHDWREP